MSQVYRANAITGEGTARILSGVVNADGTVAAGSGFTAAKTATGKYRITPSVAFTAAPHVNASIEASATTDVQAKVDDANRLAARFDIWTMQDPDTFGGAVVQVDAKFSFVAIGAR